jgi:hypothetical protein
MCPSIPVHKSENRKTKTKNTSNDQPTFFLDIMKLSNTFAAAFMAVLISPTIASASDKLTFNAEESSSSMSMYDVVSSSLVPPKIKVDDESPSDDSNYGRKKHHKNMGKLTEAFVTVFFGYDDDLEVSEDPDSPLALAFLEDDLVYAYKKVQEGMDLQKGSDVEVFSSHYLGKAPEDPGGDVLFPELSKTRGYRG